MRTHAASSTETINQCKKIFFGGSMENQHSPHNCNCKIGHGRLKSILWNKNGIVFAFLCRFKLRTNCFSISEFFGNSRFPLKKVYNIDCKRGCLPFLQQVKLRASFSLFRLLFDLTSASSRFSVSSSMPLLTPLRLGSCSNWEIV